MIGWPLATNTNVFTRLVTGLDGIGQQLFNRRVTLVEQVSDHTRVTVQTQRQLSQVVGTDGETVEEFKEFICQNRVGRQLTHHDDAQAIFATLEAVFSQQVDHLARFTQRAHERHHDFNVGQTHLIAYTLKGAAFQLEAIAEVFADVTRSTTEAQHRVFFFRLVQLAADQVRVFVGLKVRQTHDHLLRGKRASAIVTNRGGRTCHAAIIARELGIPAVVGCGNATQLLKDGQGVTVSCAEGDTGFIFEGELGFDIKKNSVDAMPDLPFKIMMNVGNPDRAFDFAQLPNAGVGLARLEFIINRMIGVHPKALLNYDGLPQEIKDSVDKRIAGYSDPVGFYVEKLVEGISTLAGAFTPKKVIVRLSDFKSNEYANLIGGKLYEPEEENPMLGFRGASRYISENFRDCFELECRALKRVRNEMGLTNVEIMVPFVRTLGEASQVIDLLAENGLTRGENGLRVIMMCELPSNAILADEFLEYFDGFSIGSNDLTQLTLGLDRDSGVIAHLFDERNPAVKKLLSNAIQACNKAGKYIGICGQGPSDHPDLARWLMEQGIESVSLNPDTVLETWFFLAEGQAKA